MKKFKKFASDYMTAPEFWVFPIAGLLTVAMAALLIFKAVSTLI